ncbi:MAG TPA: phosphatase PAP2 family protein [Acidimicrobiales bacterium]|jgi:undecaprenyl-diphosphatase|nr:phosphatase PAP2 family protein [Acidimicrobiales bacterium]
MNISAERFDKAVDAAFEPLRGRPQVDRVAAAVSNLADYGLIWVAKAAWKGRHSGPPRRRAIVALGAAGFSSMLVSRAVKDSVVRERPEEHLEALVRTPSSSSFPSGHTLAAFCTAVVLSETERETRASVGFAVAVAASRVHLRAHHPSDVVGGAVIGSALGLLLRPLVRMVTPGNRKSGGGGRKASKGSSRQGMGQRDYLLQRL